MTDLIRRFSADTKGATAIEYGLISALVFLAVVGAIQGFATKTTNMYNTISSKM